MKQTLTFNPSTISSTASRINVDAWDVSTEAFDNKEYLKSFYALLDYLNPEFRTKYGNVQGSEFSIPHGSIVVNLKLDNDRLYVKAPFLSLPEKNRIPLLRQVAGLNMNNMDLAQIALKDNQLYFEYDCPIALVNPWKIYYILEEICRIGDKYDDEFATKFGAERIYEPKVTPYDAQTIEAVYGVIQLSCEEALEAVKYFEGGRKFGFAWNIIATTLRKILYYAHPQGQLMNDLNKAVWEHDREDIPLPEVVVQGKSFLEKVQKMPKEQIAEDLYFVETFVPAKRRSILKNIQENFENTFDRATAALEQEDYMACCMMLVYNFYNMYYYNNVQDDINNLVVTAMIQASAKPWEEAAPILHEAMENIMEGNLTPVNNPFANMDMTAYMQAMQQGMQGNMAEIAKNIQNMMASMLGGNNTNNSN